MTVSFLLQQLHLPLQVMSLQHQLLYVATCTDQPESEALASVWDEKLPVCPKLTSGACRQAALGPTGVLDTPSATVLCAGTDSLVISPVFYTSLRTGDTAAGDPSSIS